jgi:nucleolin
VFVKGFDRDLGEDAVREQLTEAFGQCGGVTNIRLPTDRETGGLRGIGYVEFESAEGKAKAAELDGTEAAGGYLKIDLNVGGGGTPGSGRGGRGGGRGGFGGRGGGFGGRGGGRGGFGGRDGGRGGRGRGGRGDRGGRGGGRGRGDFKPRMRIDAGASSGNKVTFD